MIYVDKKRFRALDLDREDQLLAPTSYRYALNTRISQEISDEGGVKSIPGNTRFDWTPPTGSNKTIGTFEDGQANRFIFFNYNGGGEHGIYIYDDTAKTVTNVIKTSQLGFQENVYITEMAVIENYLIWTDGINAIKAINLDFDYSNFDTKSINIDLHKPAPQERLTYVVSTDANKKSNQVSSANWQFVYRYIYEDNTFSVFSPKSELVPYTKSDPFSSTNNVITVSIPDVTAIPDDVKAVEFAYEKNNSGGVYVFDSLVFDISFTGSAIFTNTGTSIAVADSVSAKLFESIANPSKALTLARNRLLTGSLTEGFPVDTDNGTNIVIEAQVLSSFIFGGPARTFKSYGTYDLGIVWHNGKKSSGVQYVQTVNMPEWEDSGPGFPFDYKANQHTITVSTAGTAPSWATRFSYVISEEGTYLNYQQFNVNQLYYAFDITDELLSIISAAPDNYYIGNEVFLRQSALTGGSAPTYLYLQMPKAIAWVPDNDTYVRVLRDKNGNKLDKIERVLRLQGDFMVVGTFGIEQADLASYFNGGLFVEVFKLKKEDTVFFYESGDTYPISELADQKTLYGDNYIVSRRSEYKFYFDKLATFRRSEGSNDNLDFPNDFPDFPGFSLSKSTSVESQSPTLRENTNFDDPEAGIDEIFNYGFLSVSLPSSASTEVTKAWTEDLTRASYSKGRAYIVLENEQRLNREETIRYSNKYVQTSNVNGLANFEANNEYVLPSERSAIRSLVAVKNIALAIHTRETTSLYLNEKFMKASSGSDLNLVFTDDFIGQDRLLQGSGNFGTINPESIREHDGQVFWWDAYNGAVLRYTNAGIFPISDYGMKSFFRSVGELYLGATVVGGYDPKYDEYVLTFSPYNTLDGFTICFDVKNERWTTWYSFEPENYVKLGNKFFSFNSGEIWQHDTNSLYNNFYGQQYDRQLKFVFNPFVQKIKVLTNVHIDQAILSADDTSGYEVVKIEGTDTESVITAADFIAREGLLRSQVFRNRLTEGGETDYKQGEQMRGRTMELTVQTDRTDQSLLKSVNIVFHSSEYSN